MFAQRDVFETDLDLEEVFEIAHGGFGIGCGLEEAQVGESLGRGEKVCIGGIGAGKDLAGELSGLAKLLLVLAFFVAFVEAFEGTG